MNDGTLKMCNTHGTDGKFIWPSVGRPGEKSSFGRPKRVWESDVEIDINEIR
jgi:hypothetical protein